MLSLVIGFGVGASLEWLGAFGFSSMCDEGGFGLSPWCDEAGFGSRAAFEA